IGVATGLMGIACDNMLSAKIVLADGRLTTCDDEHEQDLFWATKGAGFYFGAVVEITLITHPLSIFGTQEGRHWIGNFLYPIERAKNVLEEVSKLITASQDRTAGLVMILAPPPAFKPTIAVVPHYFGDPKDGPKQFQCLQDLRPYFSSEMTPLKQEDWDIVSRFEQRAIETMRLGTDLESYIDLPHGTRTGPIERRFRGAQRLSKLRALKREYDPEGVFTRELL
ncbi:MAG: hypothetical protein Q9181_005968, partial [Wetmoreana brouardii]